MENSIVNGDEHSYNFDGPLITVGKDAEEDEAAEDEKKQDMELKELLVNGFDDLNLSDDPSMLSYQKSEEFTVQEVASLARLENTFSASNGDGNSQKFDVTSVDVKENHCEEDEAAEEENIKRKELQEIMTNGFDDLEIDDYAVYQSRKSISQPDIYSITGNVDRVNWSETDHQLDRIPLQFENEVQVAESLVNGDVENDRHFANSMNVRNDANLHYEYRLTPQSEYQNSAGESLVSSPNYESDNMCEEESNTYISQFSSNQEIENVRDVPAYLRQSSSVPSQNYIDCMHYYPEQNGYWVPVNGVLENGDDVHPRTLKQTETIIPSQRDNIQLKTLCDAQRQNIKELKSELEQANSDTQVFKHQLMAMKVENQNLKETLKNHRLEIENGENVMMQQKGHFEALEIRLKNLEESKKEVLRKLQAAEATVEKLNAHNQELEQAEVLSRSKLQQETVIASLQQRFHAEIQDLKEQLDFKNEQLMQKTDELNRMQQKYFINSQQHEADLADEKKKNNELAKKLEELQIKHQEFSESANVKNVHNLRLQLENVHKCKQLTETKMKSLQEEVCSLRDELDMFERIHHTISSDKRFSSVDEVSDGSKFSGNKMPRNSKSEEPGIISNLKKELERCLNSNKNKRSKLTKLQADYRVSLKEIELLNSKLLLTERESHDYQEQINKLQTSLQEIDCVVVNTRHREEIEKLSLEKDMLTEKLDKALNRIEELCKSEITLTETIHNLQQQIAQIGHYNDEDRRHSLERCGQAYLEFHDESIRKIRQEMSDEHTREMYMLNLRLQETLKELDSVKETYMSICREKSVIELDIKKIRDDVEAEFKKMMHESEVNWTKKLHEVHQEYEKKIPRLVKQIEYEKDKIWQKAVEDLRAEKDQQMSQKVMELNKNYEIDKMQALRELDEKRVHDRDEAFCQKSNALVREHEEQMKALREKLTADKQKELELLQDKWQQEKVIQMKRLEAHYHAEHQKFVSQMNQERLDDMKILDEKREKESREKFNHLVLKKNREKWEKLKEFEDQKKKQLLELEERHVQVLARLKEKKDAEIIKLKEVIKESETHRTASSSGYCQRCETQCSSEASTARVNEVQRREMATSPVTTLMSSVAPNFPTAEPEPSPHRSIDFLSHLAIELERCIKLSAVEREYLNEALQNMSKKNNYEKEKLLHEFFVSTLEGNEPIISSPTTNEMIVTSQESDKKFDIAYFNILKEQNIELFKMLKSSREEHLKEKNELQQQFAKSSSVWKNKHLDLAKELQKLQERKENASKDEVAEHQVISLKAEAAKLEAELKVYQSRMHELETSVKIKTDQMESLQNEHMQGMRHLEIKMRKFAEAMHQKQIAKENEFQQKEMLYKQVLQQFEHFQQQAKKRDGTQSGDQQSNPKDEQLEQKVKGLESNLNKATSDFHMMALRMKSELDQMKLQLDKTSRERDAAILALQKAMESGNKSHEAAMKDAADCQATLKEKARHYHKQLQEKEQQHQALIVTLQQSHTETIRNLTLQLESISKNSTSDAEVKLEDIKQQHDLQLMKLNKQYSSNLQALHQKYSDEADSLKDLAQHYQVLYEEHSKADSSFVNNVQENIRKVIFALQHDVTEHLDHFRIQMSCQMEEELIKERIGLIQRLQTEMGLKDTQTIVELMDLSRRKAGIRIQKRINKMKISANSNFKAAAASLNKLMEGSKYIEEMQSQNPCSILKTSEERANLKSKVSLPRPMMKSPLEEMLSSVTDFNTELLTALSQNCAETRQLKISDGKKCPQFDDGKAKSPAGVLTPVILQQGKSKHSELKGCLRKHSAENAQCSSGFQDAESKTVAGTSSAASQVEKQRWDNAQCSNEERTPADKCDSGQIDSTRRNNFSCVGGNTSTCDAHFSLPATSKLTDSHKSFESESLECLKQLRLERENTVTSNKKSVLTSRVPVKAYIPLESEPDSSVSDTDRSP